LKLANPPTRIVVIADPMAPDGDRLRHSYWGSVLGQHPYEEYGLGDLDDAATVLDLKGTRLLIVSWDAANGDAAYRSNQTLNYFQGMGRIRIEEVLQDGGIVLCECQTVDGVPVQAAYDAMFGVGEVQVLSDVLPEPERRGEAGLVVKEFADHPMMLGLPPRINQGYRDLGERMFYAKYQGPEGETGPLGLHYKSTLWWGWFTWWRKGWIPLIYAELPASYLRRQSDAKPAAILLAKVHGNGMLLASTMWIAGSQSKRLVDNVLRVSLDAVRRHNSELERRRTFGDLLAGVALVAVLVIILRLLILISLTPALGVASWLLSLAGVAFIPIVTSLFAWYRRKLWGRPYGVSLVRTVMQSSPFWPQ
jgi:hypothetical protein